MDVWSWEDEKREFGTSPPNNKTKNMDEWERLCYTEMR
jgi:hypothetical protein